METREWLRIVREERRRGRKELSAVAMLLLVLCFGASPEYWPESLAAVVASLAAAPPVVGGTTDGPRSRHYSAAKLGSSGATVAVPEGERHRRADSQAGHEGR